MMQKAGRLEGLDSLRGLMLVMMMFNHLFFMNFSKWFNVSQISYGLFGYVTAAEGFYFLSGLIFALVFTRKAAHAPAEVRKKAHSRTLELFRWHILTLTFAVLIVVLFPSTHSFLAGNPFMGKILQNPGLTYLLGIFFLAMPPFLNILPLYMLYLYITPFILQRLAKHQHWLILSVSLILWGLAQTQLWFKAFGVLQARWPGLPFDAGYFDPMAWQILFVGGLLTGNLLATGRLASLAKRPLIFLPGVALAIYFLLHKHGFVNTSYSFPKEWTDVARLGFVRVINFSALALTTGLILAKMPNVFAIRPLMYLGRHSLQVFVYHVVFLYATIGMKGWIDELAWIPRSIIFVSFIASLWIPAWLHELNRTRQAVLQNDRDEAIPSPSK